MCANRVARGVGAITYTQMLNPRGGVECDFTVTRLAEDRFRIVTGTAFGRHDLAWMRMHAPDTVQVEDVTSKYACLGLWGPAAREILQPLTTEELSFGVHAGAGARRRLGAVPRLARHLRRRARLGALLPDGVRPPPLGHDLEGGQRPRARRRRLQGDRLPPAGEGLSRLGLRRDARGHALRGGAGLRGQAGEGRVHRPRRAPLPAEPERRLACLVLEDPRAVALGSEPVRVAGELVGRVTSGGYGYTVERSIAYAYLPVGRRAGHRRRGRDLRRLDRRQRRRGAALRSAGRTRPG